MPHFGISLAFAVQDQLCLGAVYAPVFNEFFYAFVGHGAFLKRSTENEAEKIHVSAINQLASSLWITGTEGGPKSQAIEKNKATFDIALNLLPITHDLRRTGSAALDLAAIASGRAEGYLELSEGLNWWDIAAGVVLVEEGGGEVTVKSPNQRQTNVFAKPIIYILATNGQKQIHERINLLILKKTRP
jgi:myo-inositol-1(or 4)-monophosphatase